MNTPLLRPNEPARWKVIGARVLGAVLVLCVIGLIRLLAK